MNTALIEKFWRHVDTSGECWTWQRSKSRGGYGYFWLGQDGRLTYAHRFSYELAHGVIPDGLFVLHHCDTPSCVRPDHLYAGTPADNSRDAVARNRLRFPARDKTHCLRGHPLSGENLYRYRGHRVCRECSRAATRRRRAAAKLAAYIGAAGGPAMRVVG